MVVIAGVTQEGDCHFTMSDDDVYRRRRAYELRSEGHPIKSICLQLECDKKFVTKWFKRGRAGHDFEDSQRSGRPRKIPQALYPKVRRLLKRKREGSALDVANILAREDNIEITGRSVENYAHELELSSYVRPKKARLVKDDRPRRIRFAQIKRSNDFWEKVFWSDEKAFELHEEPRLIWAESRDDVPPREKDLVEPSVRVWGAISARGRTPLFRIPASWKAPEYTHFLETKAIPAIRNLVGDDFIFMQDGDGAHQGKVVTEFFDKEGIEKLDDCPARSGDLWPHENMWKVVGDGVRKRKFTTLNGLWKAVKEEWDKVSEEIVLNLVRSVPDRLKEVVTLGGGVTRH